MAYQTVKPEDTINDGFIVEPGLSNLNLNMCFQNDVNLINDTIKGLYDRITDEHPYVHNVVHMMIGTLESKSPNSQMESRKRLENILKINPDNLNALAELEKLYRNLHWKREADKYKSRMERITRGNTYRDNEQKAICLLEQGYAILYEGTANIELLTKSKLSESYNMLLSEQRNSKGKRKNHLGECLEYNKKTLEHLHVAIECQNECESCIRQSLSLEKFILAKQYAEGVFSTSLIWAYYEGIAWNRKYEFLSESREHQYKESKMKDATLKATECLWRVATYSVDDQSLKVYKSRSLASIAHILIRRKAYFENLDSSFSPFCTSSAFQSYLQNPIDAIDAALENSGDDAFVLTKYGRILLIEATSGKLMPKEEKQKLLIKAEAYLTKSIDKRSLNWFAQTTRMSARLELANINFDFHRQDKAKGYFEKAREDGYQCFITRGTPKTLCYLSEICLSLAKFPVIYENGSRFVPEEQKHYLLEALHYLHFAMHQSGPTNFSVSFKTANVLYHLKELDNAIEWMKRAMSLSNCKINTACKHVCLFIAEKYRDETKANRNAAYLIKDLLFTLSQGLLKYGNIDNIIKSLYQNCSESLLLMMENIFGVQNLKIDSLRMEVLKKLLSFDSICRLRSEREIFKKFQDYNQRLHCLQIADGCDPDFNEDFLRDSAYPERTMPSSSLNEYEFDFFVCHSSKDSDWVTSKLLPDLESALTDEDIRLWGCIADRDFVPGISIFKNIEHSMTNSFKIILVLTKNFTESYWCQFEKKQALITSLDSKKDCVIPLLLSDCDIPRELKNYTYSNFTDERNYISEILKLKRALLSP